MKKEMLINVLQPEECRIAILEDGVLEELYVERTSQESYVGNVYKGRIVNIEPSIQAAFVDFGIGRNGFLHVSDVDPAYYRRLAPKGRREHFAPPRHREEFDEEPSVGVPRRPQQRGRDVAKDRLTPPPLPQPMAQVQAEVGAEAHHGDDPYAALVGEFGVGIESVEPQITADSPAETEAAAEPVRKGRRRRTGRPKSRTSEDQLGDEAPSTDEAENLTPPPLPDHRSTIPEPESAFGMGIDIWGDGPPPHMPSAERRTIDDDVMTESGSSVDDDFGAGINGFDANDTEKPSPSVNDDTQGDRPRPGGRFRDRPRDNRRHRGRDGDGHHKPLIQDIFKRGQEVVVQVIKEGIGTKGPTLSTYISIAGRYLVLMPGLNRIGVSRKIDEPDQRHRLRGILSELNPPPGIGFIIRTAGTDRNKKELQNDLGYLLRIWQVVVKRIKAQKGPGPVYQESDMITRTIRDTFANDVAAIWIDEPIAYQHALEFLQGVMPRYASRLRHYDQTEPLFHRYGIDQEIAKIQQKKVPLGGGGSLVIEQTEALVAIDVNSGNFRADNNNAEETAFQMNLQAAKEIARQLRLRDLGGVIVNDFIDMREDKHRRAVEKAMREAVKRDRARTKVLRISQFGIIEMTRQRIRPSLRRSVFQECPFCLGNGHVKTTESMSIEVMRLIQLAACREPIRRVDIRVHPLVADYLVNRRRREIAQLEESGAMQVAITGIRDVSPDRLDFQCFDANGNDVPLSPPNGPARPQPQHPNRTRR